MKIILLKDVPHLGQKSDIRDVREGYARNFLLPQKMAAPATDSVLRDVAQKKALKEKEAVRERENFVAAAKKMDGLTLPFKMKMGERGKAFGSVSAAKITEALKKQGIAVEKEWIVLDEAIKTTGEHTIAVHFPRDIAAKIKIVVEPE